MQEPDPSGVSESEVGAVEAPVITSVVPIGGVRASAIDVESILVEAFDTYAGRLKAFSLAAVRDGDVADDLVQETFLRLVREEQSGRLPDNIGGWLFRVCGNLIVSRGRRRTVAERMKNLLVDRRLAASAEEQVIRDDEHAHLKRALKALPPDARVALLMAAEGYTSAEIGFAIGRTANATSTYLSRARVRLRELLAGEGELR